MSKVRSVEVRLREDGFGWEVLLDGKDIADGISHMVIHLDGGGGSLDANGMCEHGRFTRTVRFACEQLKPLLLGQADTDLTEETKAALRVLGWQPIPDTGQRVA